MPLQQFTIADRSLITTVLKLPSDQLEENSRLYKELEKIEDRDIRLTGLNRVQEVQTLLEEIRSLQQEITELEEASSNPDSATGGINLYGFKRLTVDDEYTIDLSRDDGMVGAIGSKVARLTKKIEDLAAMLGYPWVDEYDNFPLVWA